MNYALHEGDCLNVMATLPSASVDMILTDLPYGVTENKWDTVVPLAPMWAQFLRLCKPSAAIVLTANQPFTSALVSSAPELFKYSWVWVKNRPTGAHHAKNRPMSNHEDILVFSAAPMGHASLLGDRRMAYYPQGVCDGPVKTVTRGNRSRNTGVRPNQIGRTYTSQSGFPHTVLAFDKESSHYHPTQKPVDLMRYLIRTYTKAGETVLDATMGSGTTGLAALAEGRKFIGIEKDPSYFDIATARIASL